MPRSERRRRTPDASPGGTATGLPDLGGLTVMLAEDDQNSRTATCNALERMGAEVICVPDGRALLDRLAAAAPPDVLVLDIEMPHVSGLEAMRVVRAGPLAGLPIVALSGYSLSEHADLIQSAGADVLVSKPVVEAAALGRSVVLALAARSVGDPATPCISAAVWTALEQAIGSDQVDELLGRVVDDLHKACDGVQAGDAQPAAHLAISVAGVIGASALIAAAEQLGGRRDPDAQGGPHGDGAGESEDAVARFLAECESVTAFTARMRGTR